ncbi:MAG: hypothetical protein RIR26_2208 [Pseudomonadota bacterium]
MPFESWGVGLRPAHFPEWKNVSQIPVLELMADNLLHHKGGPALWHTRQLVVRARGVVLHGIGLNIGGADPLSQSYLSGLRHLVSEFRPSVVSDHLCFTQALGVQSYELLPLVLNRSALEHVVERVDAVQNFLGCRYSLENVSSYVDYKESRIPEGEFLSEVARRTGCGILLDVNNVYVSAKNFARDPEADLERYNLESVTQIHIAGHSKKDDFLFDTHDEAVCADVWTLLKSVLQKLSQARGNEQVAVPVILENDNPDTPLAQVLVEWEEGKRRCV